MVSASSRAATGAVFEAGGGLVNGSGGLSIATGAEVDGPEEGAGGGLVSGSGGLSTDMGTGAGGRAGGAALGTGTGARVGCIGAAAIADGLFYVRG
jgi:hypothetical protein